jgi:enoyl-CoA hydratase/carnithine racemase
MIFRARRLSAAEAAKLGLVHYAVAEEALAEKAQEITRDISANVRRRGLDHRTWCYL